MTIGRPTAYKPEFAGIAERLAKAGADLLAGRDALEAVAPDEAEPVGESEPQISAVGGTTRSA